MKLGDKELGVKMDQNKEERNDKRKVTVMLQVLRKALGVGENTKPIWSKMERIRVTPGQTMREFCILSSTNNSVAWETFSSSGFNDQTNTFIETDLDALMQAGPAQA